MEILLSAIAIIMSSLSLGINLGINFKSKKQENVIQPMQTPEPLDSADQYNPDYSDNTVALSDFVPKQGVPLKVVHDEEDVITPLEGETNAKDK